LPIALGEATKTVAFVVAGPKTYRFTVRFGEARDTGDAEGRAIGTSVVIPTADEIRRAVEEVPGAADVTVEQLTGRAMLTTDVDRQAAGRYGIPVGEILEMVESLGTRKVGEVVEG